MAPEEAAQKREQTLRDGFCIIDDVLSEEFVCELVEEADRLND